MKNKRQMENNQQGDRPKQTIVINILNVNII